MELLQASTLPNVHARDVQCALIFQAAKFTENELFTQACLSHAHEIETQV